MVRRFASPSRGKSAWFPRRFRTFRRQHTAQSRLEKCSHYMAFSSEDAADEFGFGGGGERPTTVSRAASRHTSLTAYFRSKLSFAMYCNNPTCFLYSATLPLTQLTDHTVGFHLVLEKPTCILAPWWTAPRVLALKLQQRVHVLRVRLELPACIRIATDGSLRECRLLHEISVHTDELSHVTLKCPTQLLLHGVHVRPVPTADQIVSSNGWNRSVLLLREGAWVNRATSSGPA